MRVRRAVVDDADAIERVRTDTWRDAYRGLLPDAFSTDWVTTEPGGARS